jgi:hypothetical protein
MHELVDPTRCISNDVAEVLSVLGLEAAVSVLLDEIRGVLSFDGSYVNDHHIQLLVDATTHSGTMVPATRHGMHALGVSVLQHASFEEIIDVFLTAAARNTSQRMQGVTDNVLLGQHIPGGTGMVSVRTHPDALPPQPAAARGAVTVAALDDAIVDTDGAAAEADAQMARQIRADDTNDDAMAELDLDLNMFMEPSDAEFDEEDMGRGIGALANVSSDDDDDGDDDDDDGRNSNFSSSVPSSLVSDSEDDSGVEFVGKRRLTST